MTVYWIDDLVFLAVLMRDREDEDDPPPSSDASSDV